MSEIQINPTLPSLIPDDDEREALSGSMSFVPNIKLLQGTNDEIERADLNAGDFYFPAKDRNLGTSFKMVVVGRRNHAIQFKSKSKVKESFDRHSEVFKRLQVTKSNRSEGIQICWGMDWLLYLLDHHEFVSYFCGLNSSRFVSDDILDHIIPMDQRKTELAREKMVTNVFELFSHFETKRWGNNFKCFVPKVLPLESEPFKVNLKEFVDKGVEVTKLFMAPVLAESQTEVASDDDDR